MDISVNAPTKLMPTVSKWVWFSGSEALLEGQAVCYDFNYNSPEEVVAETTQEDADARRANHVELPSTTNAQWFAGVSARKYSAKTNGQFIEIYTPGSVCNILILVGDVDCGTHLLTFDVTDGGTDATDYRGYFRYAGLPGEGSAVTLQDVDASELTDAGDGVTCQALLQVGPPSGGVQVVQAVDDTALTEMVGGTTYVIGCAAATDAATAAPAVSTVEGLRKQYQIITTAMSNTHDFEITPAKLGVGTKDAEISVLILDAIGDSAVLQWLGGTWNVVGGYGISEA